MSDLTLAADFDEASPEAWLALVERVLKGADFDRKLISHSDDGLKIGPLYTRAGQVGARGIGAGGIEQVRSAGGAFRPLRAGDRAGAWDIRQIHGGADPAVVNSTILADLAGGVTSVEIRCRAPGQAGLPVDPHAMMTALDGVDLSICPVSLDAGENFGAAAAYLLGNWAKGKIAAGKRHGAFNADPLGTMAKNGGLAQSLDGVMAGAMALMRKTLELPLVTAMRVDGAVYHNAGASEAQELAAALASVVAYLRAAEAAGIAPNTALAKISVRLAADTDQFLTIAKFRAWRLVLARLGEAVGAGGRDRPAKRPLPVEAITSLRVMARRDPWVNMLRTTMACAGAAMGAADAITVLPFTAALGEADEFAHRIARNTQIVLAEESHLGQVADPAGGAWYVEALTCDLAGKAWDIFQKIEAEGGMAAALEGGFVQDMIAATADERAQRLARGEIALTGVTAFARPGDDDVTVLPFEDGEPSDLSGVQITPLPVRRLAEPFERLRGAADEFADRTGAPPRLFLANLGTMAEFNARARWMTNFLAAGGIEAVSNNGFTNAADVGAAFAASGAEIGCLCSTDEIYGELGEAVASLLKTAGAKAVYVAGCGGDQEAALRAAGVDEFLHAGRDALEILARAHNLLGVDQ